VKVTYTWEEDGRPRRAVHVAKTPRETYTIKCEGKPVMKAVTVEVAE
jgi:hypothetical protein